MGYFKGKQFERDIILVAVGYYCRFSLNYREVSELLRERGVSVHPTTIMRWVHEYGNIIYRIWKKKNKSSHFVWHLDETYIKVKGKRRYQFCCEVQNSICPLIIYGYGLRNFELLRKFLVCRKRKVWNRASFLFIYGMNRFLSMYVRHGRNFETLQIWKNGVWYVYGPV